MAQQILEAGTYRARALQGQLGETSSGKEQVAVLFQLLGMEVKLTWYGYFTDKTLESTFRALRTAGWKGQDLSDLSDLASQETPEVDLVVEHETDQQGTVRAKVRWVNSTGGMGLKAALPPDKAKTFAARMKAKLVAYDKAAGAPPAAKAAPVKKARPQSDAVPLEVLEAQASGAPDDTDDIPF